MVSYSLGMAGRPRLKELARWSGMQLARMSAYLESYECKQGKARMYHQKLDFIVHCKYLEDRF